MLNRQLATELLLTQVAELISSDAELCELVVAACKEAAAAAQRPDPNEVKKAQQELDSCMRTITFTRRTVGTSEEDIQQAEEMIRELQGDAARLRAKIARLEAVQSQLPRIPTTAEVQEFCNTTAQRILAAVESNEGEVIAQARRILELVTGGQITLQQGGQREPKRGWLQGRYHCRLIAILAAECSGGAGGQFDSAEGTEITIDFRRPSKIDARALQARASKNRGATHMEIMSELRCGRSMVTKLLKHAAVLCGEEYIDGRSLRFKRKGDST